MSKILEKTTRVAALALALAFGLGLTATGWGATLSSSGYISNDSANSTAVFSGVRLSDIGTKYVLSGKMGGKWVSTKEAAGVYNASSDGTTLTVQFQKIDGDSDKYVKCVIVKFTEATVNNVNTIYAYAYKTANSTTLALGQDFSSATGTPSTGDNVEGYGMFDLSLTAGKKFEFKTTGTGSTYATSGGNAAKAFWTLKVPTGSSLAEGTLVKLTDVRIGSRTDSWNATYDSAYMCVTNVNNEGIYSSLVSAYVPNLKVLWGDTACNVLQYKFPDSTPVMVNAGSASGVVFYKEDKTYGANGNDPGGCHVLQSGENVPYALNMNPYIGNSYTWRPLQEVEVLVVATATASADSNWSALAWSNGAADWTAAGSTPVLLTVTENCTITLDSAVSLESVIFDITPGKTLTLAGSSNLTAANGIVVKGGTISMASSLLRGTVYGNGTIYYNGVRPTTSGTDVVLTDSEWRGTVRITYNYADTATGAARALFPQHWGSANSKIKWNGVSGYFGGCTSAAGWILEDFTVSDTTYPALKKNDGGSSATTTAPSLEGSGEFVDVSNPSERFRFTTGSSFSGKITINRNAGNGMNVQFGATAVNKIAGTLHVLSGATMTVAANKTWAATGGIVVNGTLNVASGATIPAIATGSNGSVIAASGTATITGVQGNAISAGLGMIGGTIAVSGATSLTELTIPADTTQATQTFFAQGGGKLDLSACTSLTTLKLNLGSSTSFDLDNVILPASCTTVKYVVATGSLRDLSAYTAPTGLGSLTWASEFVLTETRYEYANGTFSVANVPANASVTVTRPDGSSVAATVTDGTARLSDYGEPKVSGDACWHAYEFNSTYTSSNVHYYPDSVSTDQRDCRTWDYADPDLYTDPDKTDNKFIYTIICPGPNKAYDYPTEWSAAIRCTTPSTANSIIVAFGNSNAGNYIALVSGDTAGKVRLVSGSGSNPVGEITSMTVANPTTSQHVYVFTKTASAVTVYCDGDLIVTKPLSLTIGNGFQFGSIYGGTQDGCGLSRVSSRETAGMVDYTRLYDFAISLDMIQKLAADDQYESSTPTYSREVSGSPWWYTGDGTWLKSDDSTLVGVPDVAGIVDLTATAAATMTVNLPAAPVYEKLTFQGAGAVTLVKNGSSPKIATAKLVVKTNVTAPYDIADFSGARVSVDAGKVLTFDFSTYPLESVTGVTTQQVTGVTTRADDRYAVVASAKSAWNSRLSLIYDPVEYVYSVVIDPAAIVTKNNTTVAYPTVGDALTAFATDAGTINLFVDYDQDITLSAGQTLDVGSTTYSGTASATGQYAELVHSGTTWKAVDNSVNTWKSSVTAGHWNTASNWENGVVPKTYTRVTFPANDDPEFTGYTVTVKIFGNNDVDWMPVCTGMVVNAKVDMVQDASGSNWGTIHLGGNISGTGTLALHKVGLHNSLGSSTPITVSCGLSVAIKDAAGQDCYLYGGPFVFEGAVTATSNVLFKAEYCAATFNGTVTMENGTTINGNGDGTTVYNGGISVPADAAATLVGGSRVTIASTVTLAAGATLTIPNAASTSGATFATSVADSYVKATAGESTTVYSVAAKTVVTVSVGSNVSLTINGNAVADGNTLKFAPGETFTYAATPAANYTAAVAVTGGTDNNGTVTVGETAITVAATATRNGITVSGVSFEYGSDYATADVTATVSDPDATYKMTVGNNEYTGVVSGSTVTFSNVATGHASAYDSVSYTITATDGETSVPVTSGGSGSAVVADSDKWVDENSGTTGTAAAGGSWSNAVTYVQNAAEIEDNTFTAVNCSTGDLVTVTIENVFYEALSDLDVSTIAADSQGAFCLGAVEANDVVTTNFMILAKEDSAFVWKPAEWSGTPALNTEYDVVFTFDYANGKYSVSVNGTALSVNNATAFDLCTSKTEVKAVDFKGSGKLSSILGVESTGYMVRDSAGHWYATIDDAISGFNAANGPYFVLHAGTAPAGWKIVKAGDIWILKKDVSGVLILTY